MNEAEELELKEEGIYAEMTIDDLREALQKERDEHTMTWECLQMVEDVLRAMDPAHPAEGVIAPMFYPEWIHHCVGHAAIPALETIIAKIKRGHGRGFTKDAIPILEAWVEGFTKPNRD